MSRFKTQFEPDYNGHSIKEVNNLPSKTVPDQSMSIREIFHRFASGLPSDGAKVEIWDGEDDDMPELHKMDLADREALINGAKHELDELKTNIKEKSKPKEKPKQQQQELGLPVPVDGANPKDLPKPKTTNNVE